jgi:MFS transporter, FSR family, fosmidomycin resistance protein
LTGLFGSIYHPVGISWLIRNAANRGQAIGLNGVFGGIGPAVASLIAGTAISLWGWRVAFTIPGAILLLLGAAFIWAVWTGRVVENRTDRVKQAEPSKGDTVRAGLVLSVTMLCAGMIYQASQPTIPKLFEDRLGDGSQLGNVAAAVTAVYLVAGLSQILAGYLADRFSPRSLYTLMAALQIPLLLLLTTLSGLPMVAIAMVAVTCNMASIPAENILLSRYTPARWRGTAFGLKFVLSFGVSGLAVPLVSFIRATTGDFTVLFIILAVAALITMACSRLLPQE